MPLESGEMEVVMIFQITAAVLMLVFYGAYFAKMISQHRQGISTDLLGKGKTGFVKFVEIALKVVTLILPAAEALSIIFDINIAPLWLRIAGAAVGIAGVIVFIISVVTMGRSWRAGVSKTEKTELVTSGIYSVSRNPAFLGFDLLYIGIGMMFFNLWLAGITMAAVIMLHLQIVNVEEDHLSAAFGDEYLVYRKKVRRYLGRRRD